MLKLSDRKFKIMIINTLKFQVEKVDGMHDLQQRHENDNKKTNGNAKKKIESMIAEFKNASVGLTIDQYSLGNNQ